MKLIFLLIFVFNLLSVGKTKDVSMHGQLERYDYRLISVSLSKSYGFYLDMSEFEDVNSTIEIKIDIYNGYLTENEMYFGFTDVLYPYYKDLIFHAWVNYTSKTSMEKKDTKIDTYYYKIPKSDKKYLYISVPDFSLYFNGKVEIRVVNHLFFEGSVKEIIGLVLGGIALVFIIILAIYLIKLINNAKIIPTEDKTFMEKAEKINENPANNQYIPPTSS